MFNYKLATLTSALLVSFSTSAVMAEMGVLGEGVKNQITAFSKLKPEQAQQRFCDFAVINHKLVDKNLRKSFVKFMNAQLQKQGKRSISCSKVSNLPEAKGSELNGKTVRTSYRSAEGFSPEQLQSMRTVQTLTHVPGNLAGLSGLAGATAGVVGGGATGFGLSLPMIIGGAVAAGVVVKEITKEEKGISGSSSLN